MPQTNVMVFLVYYRAMHMPRGHWITSDSVLTRILCSPSHRHVRTVVVDFGVMVLYVHATSV